MIAAVVVCAGVLFWCDHAVSNAAVGRIVTRIEDAPTTRVALLLGTAPRLGPGRPNPHYTNRLDAAVALFHAGKVRKILVSGDNAHRSYNEPKAMRDDLIARGVPPDAVVLDYAGFRTLDSVVRAREVFGLSEAIVISQRFHIERAIFLGDRRGLKLTGLAAADAPRLNATRVRVREVFARMLAVIDVVLARSPKFLGPRIALDG